LVVVFVPSLCCVVELVLDWPFAFEAEVVDVCFEGSLVFVVLLFCPSGFSVVVVLEVLWANPAPLNATPSARAIAVTTVFDFMVFLLIAVTRGLPLLAGGRHWLSARQ
jgi:hypothetical protein